MKEFVAVTKALSDTNRVRALLALKRGEACVCRLIELLGRAPSTVSKHMSILKNAGLVESRKEGRWIYYRLCAGGSNEVVCRMIAVAIELLGCDRTIASDRKRMAEILKQDPGVLCREQKK